ncbi:MAG TPA: NAD-dependent dehydratase, partial [Sphingorhabdus sp.]|nr:NAD-dependent dehydratase [Sphingorhabdus sp.]
KGETDKALAALDFARVDILRPGLLVGQRGGERRFGERIGILVSPFTDLFMLGSMAKYRSTPAAKVARAIAQLATTGGEGRFVHENDSIDVLAG